jgi:hypothetical protein
MATPMGLAFLVAMTVYGPVAFVLAAAGELRFGGSLDPTYMAAAGPVISSPEAIDNPPDGSGYPPLNLIPAFWSAARVIPQACKCGVAYRGIIIPGGMVSVVEINNTGHPLRRKTAAISLDKVTASGSLAAWKMRNPNFGRSERLSVSDIFSASCADILRHANSDRSVSVLNSASAARALASAACFSAIPTLSSASRCASPPAVMARRITTYSIISPTPISPLAMREPIISAP